MHREEENCDNLSCDCASYELSEHDFGTSVGQSSMPEEEVSQTVQVLHLDISARQNIRLFVILD